MATVWLVWLDEKSFVTNRNTNKTKSGAKRKREMRKKATADDNWTIFRGKEKETKTNRHCVCVSVKNIRSHEPTQSPQMHMYFEKLHVCTTEWVDAIAFYSKFTGIDLERTCCNNKIECRLRDGIARQMDQILFKEESIWLLPLNGTSSTAGQHIQCTVMQDKRRFLHMHRKQYGPNYNIHTQQPKNLKENEKKTVEDKRKQEQQLFCIG